MIQASPAVEIGLGLGSNIGDKAGHVRTAARLIEGRGIARHLRLSGLYRTAPWGNLDQDWFVNACAVGTTELAPADLLARLKELETEIGRTATVRWGPRVIDIDILFYGEIVLDTPALTLPHRDLANRAFVVIPLAELRPQLRIGGRTVGQLAADHADPDVVRLDEEPSA